MSEQMMVGLLRNRLTSCFGRQAYLLMNFRIQVKPGRQRRQLHISWQGNKGYGVVRAIATEYLLPNQANPIGFDILLQHSSH